MYDDSDYDLVFLHTRTGKLFVADSFEKHFKSLEFTATKTACKNSSLLRIKLRDTESYITEIVQGLVDNLNLPIGGFV